MHKRILPAICGAGFTAFLVVLLIFSLPATYAASGADDPPFRADLLRDIDLLFAYSNAGEWGKYVEMLFVSRLPDDSARHLAARYEASAPEGDKKQVVAWELISASFDESGTFPADWSLLLSVRFVESSHEMVSKVTLSASHIDGRWYFVEPDYAQPIVDPTLDSRTQGAIELAHAAERAQRDRSVCP